MEFDFVIKLGSYLNLVQQKMAVEINNQHYIFKSNGTSQELDQADHLLKQNWRQTSITAQDELRTYIQRFVGSPMCFEISLFKKTLTKEQKEDDEI